LSEGFVAEIAEGAVPALNWGQWLGGTGNDYVYAMAEYGGSVYAAGASMDITSWEAVTFQGVNEGTQDGFLIKVLAPSDPESAAPHF
jgi:hypothetical protein